MPWQKNVVPLIRETSPRIGKRPRELVTSAAQHSSGNFANDRERAAEAGRKGGQASHGGGGRRSRAESGGKGTEHNPGNFAEDREKASAAGREGGHSSH